MAVLAQRLTNFVNLYDFGNAHGRGVYNKFEDFQAAVLALVEHYKDVGFYMGVTNSRQGKECKWLGDLGFNSVNIGTLMHHYASYHEIAKDAEDILKRQQEREEAHKAALDARPRNAAGRLLRADGTVIRRPYEYFVGDRVRFRERWGEDWKEGTVRRVTGTGIDTSLTLRTRTIYPAHYGDHIELTERAQ